MMNAMLQARLFLEEHEAGYFFRLLNLCSVARGMTFMSPELVYMVIPYDPVEGDHAHTAYVLIIAGNAELLLEHEQDFIRAGFTHVAWNRGLKPGNKDEKKLSIANFKRLLRCATK